jgi:hypothetical protein
MGRLSRLYPVGLALAGVLVGLALLIPFRSVPFQRSDGEWVKLPAPTRLNHTSDTWDYLQLGRELQAGHGFSSLFTYVPFLPESVPSAGGPIKTFPMFWRQPGFPVMVAGALSVTGVGEPDALLWLQGLAVVLLPLVTYALARLLVSPGWAAWAGLWALFSPVTLGGAVPMVATTWFAVFLALLVAAFLSARSPVAWVGAGLLLGLTVLFRLETWVLVPGLLVLHFVSGNRRGVSSAILILGTAILVVVPWHVRQAMVTGDPFYNASSLLYHDTATFPGWDSSRTLAVRDLTIGEFARDHGGELFWKSLRNLGRFCRDLVLLPSPMVLRLPKDRRSHAYLLGGAVSVLTLILVLSPMEYSPRFLGPLVPLMGVGAVISLTRISRFKPLLAGAATVVGSVLLVGFLTGRGETGTADRAIEDLNLLMGGRLVERGDRVSLPAGVPSVGVALCDAPTIYAWIWERPAVWAPLASDVPRVRELLPGSFAMFTRARGGGAFVRRDIVVAYVRQGGRPSGPEPPVLVTWEEGEP